jgi:uncharacterized membrane protein
MKTAKQTAWSALRPLAEPHIVFLLLGAFFGLILVFTTPPALVGDEPNHFFRAYQISDGVIVGLKNENARGGWIPKTVLETNRKLVGDIEMNHDVKFDTNLIREVGAIPLNEEDKIFVPFHNTVVYAPVPYIPQVLGILIGKLFGASALALIYFARIFNLIFFLALSYLAIKKTPVFKWVFCFLWLTPTTMFQAASASIDALTFGVCFLVIAHFLRYALDEDSKIGKAEIAKLFVMCFVAALCKQAYVFLPLLFLTIPRRKFGSTKIYLLIFFVLAGVCFAGVGAWSAVVKPLFMPYRGDVEINPDAQLNIIFNNPFKFLYVIIASYINYSGYYFVTFFGQLTWLDLFVPRWLTIYLFVIVTVFALLDKKSDVNLSRLSKLIFTAIIVFTGIVIATLLYLTWSPIGGERVSGIQGRYFIPIAPLFFLLFYNQRLRLKSFERFAAPIVYLTVTFSLVITLWSIIMRYYV